MPIYQNGVAGALKGAAFVFDLGPLCIVHLGDPRPPTYPRAAAADQRVDVALIPIGGTYTMGPDIAREVLQQLKPKIPIPMHYRDNLVLVEAFAHGGLATRRRCRHFGGQSGRSPDNYGDRRAPAQGRQRVRSVQHEPHGDGYSRLLSTCDLADDFRRVWGTLFRLIKPHACDRRLEHWRHRKISHLSLEENVAQRRR